jgi:hypothetical protein
MFGSAQFNMRNIGALGKGARRRRGAGPTSGRGGGAPIEL